MVYNFQSNYNYTTKIGQICPRVIFVHLFNILFLQFLSTICCLASVEVCLLFKGGFYSKAPSIQGRLLFKGAFYSRARSIQGRFLFKGAFYSRAPSIQGRLLFKGAFYSKAASIQLYNFLIFFYITI